MSVINIGKFHSMESMGSITNSQQLGFLRGRIEGKVVCDFGAGVSRLLGYTQDEGVLFTSGYEIDPIFVSPLAFQTAVSDALEKIRRIITDLEKSQFEGTLNIAKGRVILDDFSSEKDTEDYRVLEDSMSLVEKKIEGSKKIIASLLEQRGNIESNQFSNRDGIVRKPHLSSKMGAIDTFILTSVFYGSKTPAMLLFGLNKLLSDNGDIMVFDHENKTHIPRLLKLDGKDGIEVLSKEEDECVIRIPKSGIKKAREIFR